MGEKKKNISQGQRERVKIWQEKERGNEIGVEERKRNAKSGKMKN